MDNQPKTYLINESIVNDKKFDDIVKQSMRKHFRTSYMKIPIATYPELKLPKSYVDYTKEILVTLNPRDTSARTIAMMLSQAFSDLITGGNLDVDESNLNPLTKQRVSQAVLQSLIFGTSAQVQFGDNISIKSTAEFYYDDFENVFYSATDVIKDSEDTILYEERRIKEDMVHITKQYTTSGKKHTRVYEVVPYDDDLSSPISLGVKIYTNNEINDDWVGTSVFHEVIPDIQMLAITEHEYSKAMLYTKPRLFIQSEMIETDINGNTNLDLTEDVYVAVDGSALPENQSILETSQFKFDATSFSTKINDSLNLILSKLGLDAKILASGGSGVEKSAREVDSEDNRMFSRIEKYRDFYTPQIIEGIKLINLDTDTIEIRFLPLQYMNFSSSVQNVQQLVNAGTISYEKAVEILFPRMTGEQRNQEVERIKVQMSVDTPTKSTIKTKIKDDIGE